MLYRLRNDFHLSVITLMNACAIVGITPFAIWRFLRGEYWVGLIDLGILGSIVGATLYAWRTHKTAYTGLFLALLPCTGGAIAISLTAGEMGLFWLYPALICSFMLTLPLIAALLPLGALALLILEGSAFSSSQQMWSFSVTLVVVCACTYVFARRSEHQHNRLKHLALLDPLTGASNRRALDEALARAASEHERQGTEYGLVLADLDHFKRVNDTHGHHTGDRILVDFVGVLALNTRRSDQLFRFGGEEFVILMSGATPNGLQAAVEHVQSVLRKTLTSPSGPVTASFGTAILQRGESVDRWFERADEALYQAKKQGRDCIVAGESSPTSEQAHTENKT